MGDRNLAWIDLETTGTDERRDQILEVGCLVTGPDLEVRHRFGMVVAPRWPLPPLALPVMQMHLVNGLWEDCLDSRTDISYVDMSLAECLDEFTVGGRIVLAGSGVAHFDRRFIDAQMPETAKRLAYYVIDVGVVRRFATEVVGLEHPEPQDKDAKPHRGLDDAALHLSEAQAWAEALGRLGGHTP